MNWNRFVLFFSTDDCDWFFVRILSNQRSPAADKNGKSIDFEPQQQVIFSKNPPAWGQNPEVSIPNPIILPFIVAGITGIIFVKGCFSYEVKIVKEGQTLCGEMA